jgi:uncharacterized tellurite resistance protein B-like protein
MRKKRNDPKWVDDPGVAERAIILQVLRDDHHERWTRKELKREIYDIKGRTINKALKRLQEEGVVDLDGEYVWSSRCAQYMDELGMVSI